MTSFQNRQDPADIDLSICPGTLIGGGGENDLEIFDNAAANSYVTNGYQFLWEVSSSFDNGLTFSAYAPAANGVFPNSGIAGTQTAGNPYYNTDTQYPFYSYFNTNGVYKFRLKMTNACGSTYSAGTGGVINVTVGGVIATASANPNPDVICNNQTLTLAGASVGGGALNGQWSVFSSTGTGTAPDNTNLSNTAMQNNAGIASTVFTPPVGFSGTVTLRLTTEVVAAVCPGGTSSSSFSDRVVQVGALPTVTCPSDITTASCTVTSVNYIATFTGNPTVTYSILSGSNFPVGATTPVTVTAENGCATVSCTFNVTVPGDNSITPTFTGLNPTYTFCAGSTAPILPTSSTNSPVINGNWFVGAVQTPVVNNMLIGTTTYTFVPGAGQCAQQYSISVTVNALPIVTIDGLASVYCKDAQSITLMGTPAGGAFTIDGNSATSFDPALLSAGPHTVVYSVTDANTCSNSVSTTVTVNALPVVSFPGTFSDQCNTLTTFALTGGDPAGGVYSGAGVTGSNFDASAAALGPNTITYVYTDTNGCSNSATNNITVINCTTIAGSVISTGNTPVTVSGTNVPDGSAFVSLLDNSSVILQTKEVIGGVYSFNPVVDGTYKIILHNLAAGSATPIFPNGYAAFRIEGAIGSAGDTNPNGVIEITLPLGTITPGAKIAAGTVDASFGIQAGPLPVRLISFTGKSTDKGNELSWKTSQEQNFSHYEIERSADSRSFKNIGKVIGSWKF